MASSTDAAGEQPQVNARLAVLDRMRARTQRTRREFFERRSDADFVQRHATGSKAKTGKTGNDPVYLSIGHRERRFLKPSHIQNPDPCLSDLKYYTEVTLRQPKQEPKFNALNRNSLPHPQWNTPRPDTSQYKTSELPTWEAEVIKQPPALMSYSLPMRVKTPQVTGAGADCTTATTRTMFRPVDRFELPQREYMVDPEWVSEDDRISKARATRFVQAKAV